MVNSIDSLVINERLMGSTIDTSAIEIIQNFYNSKPKEIRDEKLNKTGYCVECHACNSGCYMCQF